MIAPLKEFIKLVSDPDIKDIELIAEEYLLLYGPHTVLNAEVKLIQPLVPNIPIKSKSRLLELYGIEPIVEKDNKNTMCKFNPHKYVLSTMVNAVSFTNFDKRIKFAFEIYDEDDDGFITKEELIKNLKYFGKES